MDRNSLADNLIDFSKNLLVLVFAIFSFISSSLLETDNYWVKFIYILALCFSVYSIYCGFQGMLIKINYFLEVKKEENVSLALGKLKLVKKYIEKQYRYSITSLILLVIAVFVKFEIYKMFNNPIKTVYKEYNEIIDPKLDLKIFINKYDLEIDR